MAEQQFTWQEHFDAGRTAQDNAHWDDAEEHFQAALALAESATHRAPEQSHKSLMALAYLRACRDQYREALELGLQVLALQEEALGPTHVDLVETLTFLSRLFRDVATQSQSEAWSRRALEIAERAWGTASPEIVASLEAVALSMWRRGGHAESEPYWLLALDILERNAEEIPWCAQRLPGSLSCLSLAYWQSNQWSKMEASKRRELAMAFARDEDEVTTGRCLRDIGLACKEQGKFREADEAFAESFVKYEHWFRSTTNARRFRRPDTRGTARSLRASGALERGWILDAHADVREALGDNAGARSMRLRAWRNFRIALRHHDSTGRGDSIATREQLASLAKLSESLGRHQQAVECYERLLRVYEQMFQKDVADCAPESVDRVIDRYQRVTERVANDYARSLTALGRESEVSEIRERLRALTELP
jgi:tetratricopeptide (TPR) repeat protein